MLQPIWHMHSGCRGVDRAPPAAGPTALARAHSSYNAQARSTSKQAHGAPEGQQQASASNKSLSTLPNRSHGTSSQLLAPCRSTTGVRLPLTLVGGPQLHDSCNPPPPPRLQSQSTPPHLGSRRGPNQKPRPQPPPIFASYFRGAGRVLQNRKKKSGRYVQSKALVRVLWKKSSV